MSISIDGEAGLGRQVGSKFRNGYIVEINDVMESPVELSKSLHIIPISVLFPFCRSLPYYAPAFD